MSYYDTRNILTVPRQNKEIKRGELAPDNVNGFSSPLSGENNRCHH